MRLTIRILTICLLVAGTAARAQEDRWLHIFHTHDGKERVAAFPVEDIYDNTFSEAPDHSAVSMTVTCHDGTGVDIPLADVDSCVFGTNIPSLYIDVADNADIQDKENWLQATVRIRAYGSFQDLGDAAVTVKGRGNTTWEYPKKPYTIKFGKKTKIGTLNNAKSFVLLANYLDNTLMRNMIAIKVARMMGMEFHNNFEPVNLYLNGEYRGAYLMTEKIGINAGSVNIDETKGVLFELDTNYDEDYCFHSEIYDLPVMVKDPDFDELAEGNPDVTADSLLRKWQADFEILEHSIAGLGDARYDNYMDMRSVANYLLVNAVCSNREINHPKSVFMYKKDTGGKYFMGPVWDFDWAFTFEEMTEGAAPYARTLIKGTTPGARLLRGLVDHPDFVWEYYSRWQYFRDKIWPQVLEYMDRYADMIMVSALQNGERWPQEQMIAPGIQSTETFRSNYQKFRRWMINRINWLDSAPHLGLY